MTQDNDLELNAWESAAESLWDLLDGQLAKKHGWYK